MLLSFYTLYCGCVLTHVSIYWNFINLLQLRIILFDSLCAFHNCCLCGAIAILMPFDVLGQRIIEELPLKE